MEWKSKIPFRKKKKAKKLSESPTKVEIPVKLEIVNKTHQTMALIVSEIAKIYPKNFDMLKHILTEYAFFLESILEYRKSGNPEEMFKKFQEFMIRSVKGYLEKYEDSDEIIDEEKEVLKSILRGIASIQDQVKEYEGFAEETQPSLTDEEIRPTEDWGDIPEIIQKGGLPSADAPITDLKGIGEKTAKKLEAIGVKTIPQYIEYQKAVANGKTKKIEDNKDSKENE